MLPKKVLELDPPRPCGIAISHHAERQEDPCVWHLTQEHRFRAGGINSRRYTAESKNHQSGDRPLQGAEEFEKGLFFGGLSLFKLFFDMSCFATVAQDGVGKGQRGAIERCCLRGSS